MFNVTNPFWAGLGEERETCCAGFGCFLNFGAILGLTFSKGQEYLDFALNEDATGVQVCDRNEWEHGHAVFFSDGVMRLPLQNNRLLLSKRYADPVAGRMRLQYCHHHAGTKNKRAWWEPCDLYMRPIFANDYVDRPCAWAIDLNKPPPLDVDCGDHHGATAQHGGLCGIVKPLDKLISGDCGDSYPCELDHNIDWRSVNSAYDVKVNVSNRTYQAFGGLPTIFLANPTQLESDAKKWFSILMLLVFLYVPCPICLCLVARFRNGADFHVGIPVRIAHHKLVKQASCSSLGEKVIRTATTNSIASVATQSKVVHRFKNKFAEEHAARQLRIDEAVVLGRPVDDVGTAATLGVASESFGKCPKCSASYHHAETKFCHECGAKRDGAMVPFPEAEWDDPVYGNASAAPAKTYDNVAPPVYGNASAAPAKAYDNVAVASPRPLSAASVKTPPVVPVLRLPVPQDEVRPEGAPASDASSDSSGSDSSLDEDARAKLAKMQRRSEDFGKLQLQVKASAPAPASALARAKLEQLEKEGSDASSLDDDAKMKRQALQHGRKPLQMEPAGSEASSLDDDAKMKVQAEQDGRKPLLMEPAGCDPDEAVGNADGAVAPAKKVAKRRSVTSKKAKASTRKPVEAEEPPPQSNDDEFFDEIAGGRSTAPAPGLAEPTAPDLPEGF